MKRMLAVLLLIGLAVALAIGVGGCTAPSQTPDTGSETPTPPVDEQPPAAGLRLAPGLYELEDGTAQAIGTLEYSDVESGFWFLSDGTKAEGEEGKTVAVIANGSEFNRQLEPLKGKQIQVTGKKVEGASIRMAGPEIEIEKVEEITDTPGIAE